MGVCVYSCIYSNPRDLSVACWCFSHPSTNQAQDIDKCETTSVDVVTLVTLLPYRKKTAAASWRHREEQPSLASVPLLIWTVTSYGQRLLYESAKRWGEKDSSYIAVKIPKRRNTHACVCGVCCRIICKVLDERPEVRCRRRTALFLQTEI